MQKIILVDAVNTFVVDSEINREMQILLDSYPNRKIIVTNANEEQKKTFGLENLPYELFSLSHTPDKIDPVYFGSLLEQYAIDAEQLIYFEHNLEAVKSAQSVGITSYWYDSEKRDLVALKEFLDANL